MTDTPHHSPEQAPADRPTALVTGASGGIGEALARELAARHHDLVLVARSESALGALADELATAHSIRTTALVADLGVPRAGRALAHQVAGAGCTVDVLVNNAGFADYGPFAESDLDTIMGMIDLNIGTLTELTHLFLPDMVSRRRGRVLNVASTAAFMPGPLMAVYYATKAYVLSFSEAVAHELDGTGVTMTALCPGPTGTGFQARADMGDSKLVKDKDIMSADEVARTGVDALLAGRTVVVPGLANRLQALSPRFLPRRLVPGIVARAQAPTHRPA
jgi:uncharacterized protein